MAGRGATPTLLISLCRSLVTISSRTSPSPLISLVRPVSGSTTLRIMLCRASHSSLVMGFMAWIRDFCSSVRTGPSSSSPADRCHWSSEGPGRASTCCASTFSLPFFFSFFFFFFLLLFLSLYFPRFFRPSLEEEEEDEEEEELELEEEEEELDRGLLRALCLLLSVMQGEGEARRPGGEEVNLRPLLWPGAGTDHLQGERLLRGFPEQRWSFPEEPLPGSRGAWPSHLRPGCTEA